MDRWSHGHQNTGFIISFLHNFFFIFILYYLNQNFAPLLQNVISKLGEMYFIVCLCLFVFEQQRPPASSSEKCPRSPRVISSPPQGQPLNGTHRSAKFITCILQLKCNPAVKNTFFSDHVQKSCCKYSFWTMLKKPALFANDGFPKLEWSMNQYKITCISWYAG